MCLELRIPTHHVTPGNYVTVTSQRCNTVVVININMATHVVTGSMAEGSRSVGYGEKSRNSFDFHKSRTFRRILDEL